MGSLAYAWPIRPGKFEEAKRLRDEVLERGDQEHEVRSMEGMSRIKVFVQGGPHEMMIAYYEGDDVVAAAAEDLRTDHPHNQWLVSRLEEVTEFCYLECHGGLTSELVFDWHEEHGPAHTEHA